ncbi:MAG: transposase [Trebonia sp.]
MTRKARAGLETGLQELNGEPDHARLLVSLPPKAALSRLANSLKGVSSRRGGRGRSSPAGGGTTGGRTARGPRRTSPGRPAAPLPRCRASTPSSRTGPLRARSGLAALPRPPSPPA